MTKSIPYKRLLLKLSGELLMGSQPFGIHQEACSKVAKAIIELLKLDLEISVVIGGGNFYRGINFKQYGLQRTPADHIGMLATLINGIALQQSLIAEGCHATVMSALECPRVVETYRWDRAQLLLRQKHCLIFVGGTGNPYFSTDSAAALRASEMGVDLLLKATKVDGIYSQDPLLYPESVLYQNISYSQILAEKLKVMDATAVALCQSNAIPILVFNMKLLFENQQMHELLTHCNTGAFSGTFVSGC